MAVIATLAINAAFMMKGTSDNKEEAYVMTIKDPSKNIFKGIRIFDKKAADFLIDAPMAQNTEVVIIEDLKQGLSTTDIGSKLLVL